MGSRSIRAGMIWLVLGAFCSDGAETVMDFVERIGVDRLTDGRLRSAGLMSGIVTAGGTTTTRFEGEALRSAERLS